MWLTAGRVLLHCVGQFREGPSRIYEPARANGGEQGNWVMPTVREGTSSEGSPVTQTPGSACRRPARPEDAAAAARI